MSKEKETGKEKGRIRQLARYYIPYKGLFFTDMFFAMLGAAITLVIPLPKNLFFMIHFLLYNTLVLTYVLIISKMPDS